MAPCCNGTLCRWNEFRLLEKTTLSGVEATYPTRRFRFQLPDKDALCDFDIGKGDYMKLNWQVGTKARSYNPLYGGIGGSSLEPGTFDIIVKCYPDRDGASAWLDTVQIGENALLAGPFPPFPQMRTRNEGGREIGLVCFGVAISEMIALADAELRRKDVELVVLLWANRRRDDRALVDELLLLNRQHPQRFMVKQIFSQEAGGDYSGHITVYILKDVFWEYSEAARFHVVGGEQMKTDTWALLEEMGYSREAADLLHDDPYWGFLQGLAQLFMQVCCCCRSKSNLE